MQIKISDMGKLRAVLKTLKALAGKTVTLGIGKKGLWLRYESDGVMCFYAVNPEFFDEYSVENRSSITLDLDDVIAMANKKVDEVRIDDDQLSFYSEGSLAFSYSVVG
jgi:hypothetical protein